MTAKSFKLSAEQIQPLATDLGACTATDRITVDGSTVGFMYRDEPCSDVDSGWRFFSGTEEQADVDDAGHTGFYDINTIANYDPAIIPYLELPVGTELERVAGGDQFNIVAP